MTTDVLYTNTDEIRGFIGLNEEDIPDADVVSQGMELQMRVALERFFPLHDQASTDAADDNLRLWCMAFGGLRLAESPLIVGKSMGTGKDEFERYDIDWEALKEVCRSTMHQAQKILVPTSLVSAASIMSISTPDYDPIAGE